MVLVMMVLSLSPVSRDSEMIGCTFQSAASGGVWGWEGRELVGLGDIPSSVGVSPSERDGLGSIFLFADLSKHWWIRAFWGAAGRYTLLCLRI